MCGDGVCYDSVCDDIVCDDSVCGNIVCNDTYSVEVSMARCVSNLCPSPCIFSSVALSLPGTPHTRLAALRDSCHCALIIHTCLVHPCCAASVCHAGVQQSSHCVWGS